MDVLCCHILILTLGKSAALPEPAQGPGHQAWPRSCLGGRRALSAYTQGFIQGPGPSQLHQDKGMRGQLHTSTLDRCRLPGGRRQQNPSVSGTSLKPLGIVLSREKNSWTLVGSTASAAGEARSH